MALLPWILISINLFATAPAKPAAAKARAIPRTDTKQQRTWTNDDIPLLRQLAPISDLRPGSSAPASATEAGGGATVAPVGEYVKERDPQWYADQLQALQERIDSDQGVINHIQDIRLTGDGITDAIPLDQDDPGLTPEATVEILRNEVLQLQAEIGDLQDLARQNGIPPGVLR
jgi:hypothetical protein